MADFKLTKVIAVNAIGQLGPIGKQYSPAGNILIIADDRTYRVAGESVRRVLKEHGHPTVECVLNRSEALIPDERALGEILVHMNDGITLLVSVGSGSITDLTRYISHKFKKPFIAVPTAPSMDGYASSVAPLTIRGFKQTFAAVTPAAIVADTTVLAGAPRDMILAGLGDLLGKYTSLADWKLSSFVNEERYTEDIAAMVREALANTVRNFNSPPSDEVRIGHLTDALIVSGEAMQLWGDSRPASGAEHHLAHFWEMQAALHGHSSYFHGTKVGVAVILVAQLYHRIFALDAATVEQRIARFRPESQTEYTERIHRVYGPLAGDVLHDLQAYYLDAAQRTVRQGRIIANWEAMRAWVLAHVPTPEWLQDFMLRAGAPVLPAQIEVDAELLQISLENAKEVRKRYTVFRLAEDIGFI